MELLESMDEESFKVHFSERMWTVTLSDGSTRELVTDGANKSLLYEDRIEYGRLAREQRMSECDKQVCSTEWGSSLVIHASFL